MTVVNLRDVLRIARLLPRGAQAELAETLLREGADSPVEVRLGRSNLEFLSGMSAAELQALAESILAPATSGGSMPC